MYNTFDSIVTEYLPISQIFELYLHTKKHFELRLAFEVQSSK